MARGHRLNTSILLAAVHGLSGLFRAVSAVDPSLSRPLSGWPSALAMYTSVSVVTAVSISLLLLEAVLVSQSAPGGDVTCQAGTFFSGGPATVTCFFNTDVFQNKRDFIVHKYEPDQVGSEADQILLCIWLKPEKPKCNLKDGVQFNYNISDRLSLDIPAVTREFGGLYLCHLLPTDDTPDHPCNLTVLEDAGREDEIELPTSPTTIVTDTEPESQRHECPGENTAVIIVLVLLLFASVVINIYAFYFAWCQKRRHICQRNNPENSPDASQLTVRDEPLLAIVDNRSVQTVPKDETPPPGNPQTGQL